jgi:hypothetical protein
LVVCIAALDRAIVSFEGRSEMKVKHWLVILLVVFAALVLWHIYTGHGGVNGVKQAVGMS